MDCAFCLLEMKLSKPISLCSGVTQGAAPARGQTVMVWHVMTVTCVHEVTHVAVANAELRLSSATRRVRTVMATAAVRKRDLDS